MLFDYCPLCGSQNSIDLKDYYLSINTIYYCGNCKAEWLYKYRWIKIKYITLIKTGKKNKGAQYLNKKIKMDEWDKITKQTIRDKKLKSKKEY